MKLNRPTHVRKSNRSSGWMSDFTEEIPGQIAAGINRLGDGEYTSYSIYPLPPDAEYDEVVYPTEWIQATGVARGRLTVEIKQRDANDEHRLYTIGRRAAATESKETEPIQNGEHTYFVRPGEVLTATEVIELFQHYYDTHAVAPGWNLREQPEFSDSAVAERLAAEASTKDSKSSAGRAPVSKSKTTHPKIKPAAKSENGKPHR